ncbi:unnamed protein product [Moneuplotes crassus]|uniref:Uncharacterized protein n=1 Tax=Euplotes crassus TaxID=5936 RepID=A0AAD1Y4K3_EUPCR|nr:unnamed protein product [Moneuplotes crassus]
MTVIMKIARILNEQQFSNVDENPMRSCTGDKNSSMTSARVIKPFHFKSHIEIQSPLMKDLKSPKKKEEDSFKCVKKELFRDSSPESLNSQELLNDIKENCRSFKYTEHQNDFEIDKSFEMPDEDLDEGYTYNQNLSGPEHTPEISKSMADQRIPSKKKLTQNISKKPIKSSYRTHHNKSSGDRKSIFSSICSKSPKKDLNTYKSVSSLSYSKNFNKRMRKYQSQKQLKMTQKQEDKHKKELKECTFKPKISKNKSAGGLTTKQRQSSSRRRNITEFLKDQSKFEEQKLNRLKDFSQRREKKENNTFRPKIDRKSKGLTKSITDSLHSIPAYKRLHKNVKTSFRNSHIPPSKISKSHKNSTHPKPPFKSQKSLHTTHKMPSSFLQNPNSKSQNLKSLPTSYGKAKSKRKRNYITENFDIEELFKKAAAGEFKRDAKQIYRDKTYNYLYNDAGHRKSRQEKRKNEFYESKNQSRNYTMKNSKSKKMLSGGTQGAKAARLSKGSPKYCIPNSRIYKCASAAYNDKFNDLYKKARLKKHNQKSIDRGSSRASEVESKVGKQIEYRKDSKQESIPEVTKAENRRGSNKIRDIGTRDDQESDKHTPDCSVINLDNEPNMRNKLIETPKTEELEEEMRDQVLDYQNIMHYNIPSSLSNGMIPDFTPGCPQNHSFGGSPETFSPSNKDVEYVDNDYDCEDNPLLFVDVNLGPDKAERIVVFEGDTADDLAYRFSQRHDLNNIMRAKLTSLLEAEISSLNNDF